MKYIFSLLFISVISSFSLSAQSDHFIYFQTENREPFYLKMDNKIFSSSSSGYVIMSRLKEGNYLIKFGFPKNQWPEQTVNLTLDKDAGYIIKTLSGKGWGLFNLQSNEVINTSRDIENSSKPEQEMKDDDFSRMLANVVNDSTIKEKDAEVKKPVKEVVKEDVKDVPAQIAAVKEDPVIPPPPAIIQVDTALDISRSIITKTLQLKNKNGMEMVYTDEYNSVKDTIRIFMPLDTSHKKNDEEKMIEAAQVMPIPDTLKNILQDSVIHNTINDAKKNAGEKENKLEFLPPASGMINSNCKAYAGEEDFLKLRKKMAAEKNDGNMIKVAKKFFKAKCFSTDYIKKISTLFFKDEGKYLFYDAVYPYVSDSDIFYTLENQLTDQYYINRFRAMVHK